jgi:hypothetical protein
MRETSRLSDLRNPRSKPRGVCKHVFGFKIGETRMWIRATVLIRCRTAVAQPQFIEPKISCLLQRVKLLHSVATASPRFHRKNQATD